VPQKKRKKKIEDRREKIEEKLFFWPYPENKRKDEADKKAGCKRKVKGEISLLEVYISWQFTQKGNFMQDC